MAESTVLIIMLVLILIGVLATVIYYIARYSFKTDYEKDAENAALELKSKTRRDAEELEKKLQPNRDARVPAEVPGFIEEKPKAAVSAPKDKKLSEALSNTKDVFFGRIKNLFGSQGLGETDLEALEEILYTSDLGPQTVERLMGAIEEKIDRSSSSNLERVREALREEMNQIFSNSTPISLENWVSKVDQTSGPHVIMVVGVNGAGKTTTIGKLAHWFASHQKTTLVAAGDTFRAAAGDQLKVWSERAQVEIFSPEGVSDPSAVAFDACQKAKAKNFKVVIVDTAGRLHTQKNLMDELVKMKRVIQKVFPDGPHEVLLVLDSNSGQNALIQARQFHEALGVTGVVLTKLDGTAKGGVAVGIVNELQLPIKLVGIGEGINDLKAFNSKEFVDSIL